MRLEALKKGEVFYFEGSTYVKSKHKETECFMIVGFVGNNKTKQITLESEVEGTGLNMASFFRKKAMG